MGRCCRYHVTLHDSEKLEVLQDRLEDLPAPVVVSGAHLVLLQSIQQPVALYSYNSILMASLLTCTGSYTYPRAAAQDIIC